jgi:hypothetical protein
MITQIDRSRMEGWSGRGGGGMGAVLWLWSRPFVVCRPSSLFATKLKGRFFVWAWLGFCGVCGGVGMRKESGCLVVWLLLACRQVLVHSLSLFSLLRSTMMCSFRSIGRLVGLLLLSDVARLLRAGGGGFLALPLALSSCLRG